MYNFNMGIEDSLIDLKRMDDHEFRQHRAALAIATAGNEQGWDHSETKTILYMMGVIE